MRIIYFENGDKMIAKDSSKDFHTKYGIIYKDEFKKSSGQTHTKEKFVSIEGSFIDEYLGLKRGAQIMMLKDIGTIITECGLGKKSTVIDAGAGSGFCACFLANIVKKIYTFEIDKRNLAVVKENIEKLKLKNIELIEQDVCEKGFGKKIADCIILDLPDTWKCLEKASKVLKSGGFLVCYSPNITQNLETVNNSKEFFIHVNTLETIKREWITKDRRARPEYQGLMHTGFLSIFRKK